MAILGLSNYPSQQSDMIGTADGVATQGLNNTALHPADFAKRYDLGPVTRAGGTGHGRTIGIVTLAADRPDVVSQFWNDIGLTGDQASATRITTVNVDGGPGAPNENAGSDETALDMEQSGGLAPAAAVRVYQARTPTPVSPTPSTRPGATTSRTPSRRAGASRSRSSARSSASTSRIRATSRPSTRRSSSSPHRGRRAFLSSGDSGAYPASRDLGSTDRTAGNPDGSPWVTSSGGTTLPGPFLVHGTRSTSRRSGRGPGLPVARAVCRPRHSGGRLRRGRGGRQRRRLQRVRVDAGVPARRPWDVELQRGRVPAAD